MKLLKPKFTLSLLLAIVALCSLTVHFAVSRYDRQVVAARKIEQLGGAVFYRWHKPILEDAVMATARSRSETQKDGRQAMVAYAEWIPYKSIGTSPPDVTPTWSIIDFTDNWEIEYVEIPDGKFTANTIEFLRTLPELRIVEVKRSGKGYYLPTEAESSQIRMVRKSLPEIDVIYMYDHY